MKDSIEPNRRTVLKTLGAGIVGGSTLVEVASAGDTGDNRRQDSFAWAQNTLFEMLESEPHPPTKDSEGDDAAHRPLWVIASMDGTGVPGSEHSPHPAPVPGIDHVVPLVDFSAQWHVHLVVNKDVPFIDGPDPDSEPEIPNFVRKDHNNNFLTSASRIQNATNVQIIETDVVFTCPIRPHNHH